MILTGLLYLKKKKHKSCRGAESPFALLCFTDTCWLKCSSASFTWDESTAGSWSLKENIKNFTSWHFLLHVELSLKNVGSVLMSHSVHWSHQFLQIECIILHVVKLCACVAALYNSVWHKRASWFFKSIDVAVVTIGNRQCTVTSRKPVWSSVWGFYWSFRTWLEIIVAQCLFQRVAFSMFCGFGSSRQMVFWYSGYWKETGVFLHIRCEFLFYIRWIFVMLFFYVLVEER